MLPELHPRSACDGEARCLAAEHASEEAADRAVKKVFAILAWLSEVQRSQLPSAYNG